MAVAAQSSGILLKSKLKLIAKAQKQVRQHAPPSKQKTALNVLAIGSTVIPSSNSAVNQKFNQLGNSKCPKQNKPKLLKTTQY
jgi:hypothetical protein